MLSLLLAAALVLSLGACGKEANPYEKYEELFEYMEREDYDSAMADIRELAGEPETELQQLPPRKRKQSRKPPRPSLPRPNPSR